MNTNMPNVNFGHCMKAEYANSDAEIAYRQASEQFTAVEERGKSLASKASSEQLLEGLQALTQAVTMNTMAGQDLDNRLTKMETQA